MPVSSLPALTAPWGPAAPGGISVKPRMLSQRYSGDAQVERPDGIHATPVNGTFTWNLGPTDALALLTFLRNHRGQSIQWTMPRETTPRAWMATGWRLSLVSMTQSVVQVTLEERFVL